MSLLWILLFLALATLLNGVGFLLHLRYHRRIGR